MAQRFSPRKWRAVEIVSPCMIIPSIAVRMFNFICFILTVLTRHMASYQDNIQVWNLSATSKHRLSPDLRASETSYLIKITVTVSLTSFPLSYSTSCLHSTTFYYHLQPPVWFPDLTNGSWRKNNRPPIPFGVCTCLSCEREPETLAWTSEQWTCHHL